MIYPLTKDEEKLLFLLLLLFSLACNWNFCVDDDILIGNGIIRQNWTCSPEDRSSRQGFRLHMHGHRRKSQMHTLTDLWLCVYLRGFGVEQGHKSLLANMHACVWVCGCLCMSPPPGQGRTPPCELQWALTWPLNTDPLQSRGQRLMPHCCQSRLVYEQLLSRSQGAFRGELRVWGLCHWLSVIRLLVCTVQAVHSINTNCIRISTLIQMKTLFYFLNVVNTSVKPNVKKVALKQNNFTRWLQAFIHPSPLPLWFFFFVLHKICFIYVWGEVT